MKTKAIIVIGISLLALAPFAVGADAVQETFQKGLFEEEANHNLDAAIKAYQAVIAQHDDQRKLAATAVFRLGECYRKLGKTNEAVAQYERVIRDFADQAALTGLARQNLLGLGQPPPAAPTPALSKSARLEQRRLLEEEIGLVETQLERLKKQQEVGLVPSDGLIPKQRELLSLRRQLAALEERPDASSGTVGSSDPAAATDEEEKELQRIKAIIKDSPDLINARDAGTSYRTRLHKAAIAGHLSVAKFLLANGADVNAMDSNPRTPLHWAAMQGHKAMVELLLANHAAVDGKESPTTPLHLAAENGHKLVVAVLLEHKANVNARNSYGWTPLHNAALYGYQSVADVLLAHKADLNAASTGKGTSGVDYGQGSTPLHIAASKGNLGMVEWLCANGANVNARNKSDITPLHWVADKGSPPLVELLLAKKADANAKNNYGSTPLIIASGASDAEVVQLLLKHGANVNVQDDNRLTPLHAAVSRQSEEVLKVLLTAKPDIEVRDKEGRTPLQVVVLRKADDIVEILLKAGADPNVVYDGDRTGVTPLHWAAGMRLKRIAELLVAHKANVNAQNNSGQSPLDLVKIDPISRRAGAEGAVMAEIGDLLRKAGANEDLQRLSFITMSRQGRNWSKEMFYKGTNTYNRYTLLESIANFYGDQGQPGRYSPPGLAFPDFANVAILRRKAQAGSQEIQVNLDEIFKSGDCSKDIWLEWGDIIEVPEVDHKINEQWSGLDGQVRATLRKCLERKVEIIVKGQSTKVTLRPRFYQPHPPHNIFDADAQRVSEGIVLPLVRLYDVVYGASVLRASSDLTRIKVRRKDPKTEEMVFNLDQSSPKPDLWLRDGDVIEVPERDPNAPPAKVSSGDSVPPAPAPPRLVPRIPSPPRPIRQIPSDK